MKYKKNDPTSQRRSNTYTVGEAIKDLLNVYRLQGKFDETRLVDSWEQLMGKSIAARTNKLFIKDKKLFVQVNSAPLKNELKLSKPKIIEIFEKEIGKDIINEIVLL
ncbi:DUF721 domain-containing protein [Fulvivirgaceae bacterium BMA12]|uniref:DUF721 domain-containing protein n=1 Tax=Agaribacillus aureus TaxID=3051825 RepID=A0ABT8LES3_9BACT|nr:DUF721 domain-containing protein [Fulvivirgaceae bacterium BMA12]